MEGEGVFGVFGVAIGNGLWLDTGMTYNYPPRIGERIAVDTELGQEDGIVRSVATTGGYATIEFADRVRMTIRYMGNGRWAAY